MTVAASVHMGLLGCGRWGVHILRDLRALGCAVAVADPSEEARQRAREGGAAAAVPTAGDLPRVDGVVVATPTSRHAEAIRSVAHRGVPIFCEKPLTADPAEAWPLAGELAGRLFVLDKWRYHPGVEALRDLARSGELGPVAGVRTLRLGWANIYDDVDPVWILAPHDLSIGLEILGTVPPPRLCTAERMGAVVAGISGTLGTQPWLTIDVSVAHPTVRREVRVVCRDGVALLTDAYGDGITIVRAPGGGRQPPVIERRPISSELPLLRELRACVEHVRGGPPPRSSAAEGARVVAVLAEMIALAGPR